MIYEILCSVFIVSCAIEFDFLTKDIFSFLPLSFLITFILFKVNNDQNLPSYDEFIDQKLPSYDEFIDQYINLYKEGDSDSEYIYESDSDDSEESKYYDSEDNESEYYDSE